ncbi:MAG: c-type cytochrome [Halarcobacter sp.]
MRKILLSSAVALLLLSGCGDEKKEAPATVEKKVETVKEDKSSETKLMDQMKESGSQVASTIATESKKIADAVPEAVKSVGEKVANTTKEITDEVVETASATKDKVVETASETKDKIEKSINEIVATKKEQVVSQDEINVKGLYLKCAGCHGQQAQMVALGKSKIIKDLSKDEIVTALKGYQDGTYGGVMKGVMKSQVANLSDKEIDALGEYISAF